MHTNVKLMLNQPSRIDVTRTELSADPVKKMGKVGCQSTVVIAAVWKSSQPISLPSNLSQVKQTVN